MKARIVATLVYAREVVRDTIEVQQCYHAGQYCSTDSHCDGCYYGPECRWLCMNDECSALQAKSIEQLRGSLEFAVELLHIRPGEPGHNRGRCRCDTCSWLRKAKRLLAELERSCSAVGAAPDTRHLRPLA
jgi:hypothetical protein